MENIAKYIGDLTQTIRIASQVQERTRNQLTRVAATSGRLRKVALASNNKRVAAAAGSLALRAGRLAKAMRQHRNKLVTTVQNIAIGAADFSGPGIRSTSVGLAARSANVRLAARSARVAIQKKRLRSGRTKGPVKMVDVASLASVTAKLRTAQEEFRALKAQKGYLGKRL